MYVGQIYLAEDRDYWRSFLNKAMNPQVHKRWKIFDFLANCQFL
jgi:hypothetical protein